MRESQERTPRAGTPSARVALALGATLLASLAIAATAASQGGGDPAAETTLGQKIVPGTAFSPDYSQLTTGPGEQFTVRQEGIGTAGADRAAQRRSLLYFSQLSDFQLADEESPARVEATDPFANPAPFESAWRPMEALGAQTTDAAIEQINKLVPASPVAAGDGSRARMEFALTTGDSADNQQRNETEWVVRLLEGGPLDPNSGSSNPADAAGKVGCTGVDTADAPNYTGVQDYDDYFEGPDPAFYDPDEPRGGTYARWPSYPGLMDRAQKPFGAIGLDVPSYVVFGNHDGLMQGNQAANGPVEQVATGCLKPIGYPPVGDPRDLPDFLSNLTPETLTRTLETNPTAIGLVPPDPNRSFVSRPEYKALHDTGDSPNAHGFGLVDPAEDSASKGSAGYYSFAPKPGIRFIALDTVSEGGVSGVSHNGNIDDPQFRWLEAELKKATAQDELIFLFSHHAIANLTAGVPDEVAPPCTVPDSHGHDINPGCDLDPRLSLPIHLGSGAAVPVLTGENLQGLVHRYPHVVAWVAGHSHENKVEAFQHPGGVPGGFWSIRTSAEIDWPQQSRLLEVMDNGDGNLSIFGTVVDHSSPVTSPAPGTNANAFGVDELASLSRTFSFNDPQSGGATAAAGGTGDRNAELLVRDPRRGAAFNQSGTGPDAGGGAPDGGGTGPTPTGGGRTITGTAGNDRLIGTPGSDVIICSGGDDRVVAGAGDDFIDCGDGDDTINAGAGNDRVLGGAGDDFIRGSSGSDRLSGGSGDDRIGGGSGADSIGGDSGNDRIAGNSGRDFIVGGSGRDRVSGNGSGDRIRGGSGRDRISGNTGNDRINGNSGRDRLSGNSGRDRLAGGSANDRIRGGSGNDRLFGDSGNDRLRGGSGRDRLRGGTGRDRLNGGPGRDRVSQR